MWDNVRFFGREVITVDVKDSKWINVFIATLCFVYNKNIYNESQIDYALEDSYNDLMEEFLFHSSNLTMKQLRSNDIKNEMAD